MGCNTLVEPACRVVGHLIHAGAGSAAGGVLDALAQAIAAGVRWVVVNTATWWLQFPSPDLSSEPAIARIQQWLLPITAAVAAGGVIAAGARMTLSRRANPLIDVTGGLLTLAAAAVYAAAFTMAGSGRGARTTLMVFVLLVFSVLTLPALMKFFTWTTGAIGAPSGGGQLLGAATIGALAVGALRPGGGG